MVQRCAVVVLLMLSGGCEADAERARLSEQVRSLQSWGCVRTRNLLSKGTP